MMPSRSVTLACTPMSCVTRIIDERDLALHLADHAEHVLLHHHVERGGRLVGDDEVGPADVASAIVTRWRMPPESSCG